MAKYAIGWVSEKSTPAGGDILMAKYAIGWVSEKSTPATVGAWGTNSGWPTPCNLHQLKNVALKGTSPPAHNYGYVVRPAEDFVKFDIGALQTDGQTCAKYI